MQHVIFDFDGTLVDSRKVFLTVYNQLARQNRFVPLTDDNLEAMRSLSIRERCQQMGIPMYRLPWLGLQLAKQYRQHLDQIQFNPGIKEMLQDLHSRGHPIWVLSSNSEDNIRQFFRQEGIESWLRGVYSSNRIFGKAQQLQQLMRREKVQKNDMLYVGDEERDILACQQAGVKIAAVTWGYDPLSLLQKARPDVLISDPQELLGHLG
ncbi:HAD hydrolase-like protein [Deinococcus roseus]|uniref:Phosphoglycolate phosphatase n=1 Tax=Deinococcus roseus TaxID=392414 RepID=A0ABQ2DDK8_9DEIO|nr:HAD hydrolase-like protein [Deinococcus roseus]GGJ54504.1 phosphoglycolate phosphatase [Deinococcus roseus]